MKLIRTGSKRFGPRDRMRTPNIIFPVLTSQTSNRPPRLNCTCPRECLGCLTVVLLKRVKVLRNPFTIINWRFPIRLTFSPLSLEIFPCMRAALGESILNGTFKRAGIGKEGMLLRIPEKSSGFFPITPVTLIPINTIARSRFPNSYLGAWKISPLPPRQI